MYFLNLTGIIATGKESAVLHAVSDGCSMSQDNGQTTKGDLYIASNDDYSQIHFAVKVMTRVAKFGFLNYFFC